MAVDLPTSLIREIQLQLRKDAGVPDFDPGAPADPLPTLSEAIAASDPLPHSLRCSRCRGGLLRGLQSMICVYCGAEQRRDASPPPISFTSTFAYRRLLEFLDAEGSEAVAFATSTSDSTGHQIELKDGTVLSDLLNLELRWLDESKDIRSETANKVTNLSEHSMDLKGVDLDNFFSNSRAEMIFDAAKEISVHNEHTKSTESHRTSYQENLNMFENLRSSTPSEQNIVRKSQVSSPQESINMFENLQSLTPSEQTIGIKYHPPAQESLCMFENIQFPDKTVNSAYSEDGQFGDSFSAWEAEFQSAGSGTHPIESISADPSLVPSTSNLARPVDAPAGFSAGMDLKLETNNQGNGGDIEKTPDQLSCPANNWIQDDTWHANDTKASNKTEHFEVANKSNDWFDDGLWQSSNSRLSNNAEKPRETDDSLDVWRGNTSTQDLSDPFSSWPQMSTQNTVPNGHASDSTDDSNKMDFGSFSQADLFSGASGIHKGSTETNIVHLETSPLDRKEGEESKNGVLFESQITADNIVNLNAPTSVASTDPNVEMLISQMHDLSFMLEDKLSIPKKVEAVVTQALVVTKMMLDPFKIKGRDYLIDIYPFSCLIF